ncbi:hypothetical protein Prudu_011357 [Prunus dulcis]|uniref:Uncharacterized protein n=1 Tax=Prunus dulcis TaxID=3755 RepID=A0A4Y1RAG9_PRUDU|nr:hypothetical protein Prudu_011357 [Prunus dulcis]
MIEIDCGTTAKIPNQFDKRESLNLTPRRHRRSHYRSRRETSVELLKRRQIPESELWAITCKPQRKDIKG